LNVWALMPRFFGVSTRRSARKVITLLALMSP